MSVSSVSGASSAAYTQALQQQAEASKVQQQAPEDVRKKEEQQAQAAQAAQTAPEPTSNLNGQVVGQVVNTFA